MNRSRRFVVQHHTGYGPAHWDLMLEDGEALATWRLHRDPSTLAAGALPATRIGDHRKAYLTYEGPVSNNRGAVCIVDAGTYRILRRAENTLALDFTGRLLRGRITLTRNDLDDQRWTLAAEKGDKSN